jgi:amidase
LHGARIGVVRSPSLNADTARVFEATVGRLRELGATIVDPAELPGFLLAAKSELYATVRTTEFTAEIDRYLAGLGPGEPHTLSELVARAEAPGSGYDNPPKLKSLRQSLSAPPITDPVYLAARRDGLKMMRSGMAAVFERYGVEALVYPSTPKPAGDVEALPDKLSSSLLDLAAVSGLPDLTIPAGMSREGLPIGVSFLGRPFSEPRLLAFGYDLEQATHARVDPRTTPALSSDKLAAARRH